MSEAGPVAGPDVKFVADVLDAQAGKFCITWQFVEFAVWRRKNPWRWQRVLPKWFVEMRREEKQTC